MTSLRLSLLMLLLVCQTGAVRTVAAQSVQYNHDVRPILSERCFHCHGPDKAARQADLRLDVAADVSEEIGVRAIHPGHPDRSELIRRITSADPDERMPPPESGSTLTGAEVRILRQWIRDGAEYETHWAFLPPRSPPVPALTDSDWPRNPIDNFVYRRLQSEQRGPADEAEPSMLIRRITLDLTGLPPTLEEVDEYLRQAKDDPETAYSEVVCRLLKSPRYGEHMAAAWLDAARYADTNGYFTDETREMWPWRDWVISAFNANMPFDQFTVEQLAGDLLPHADVDQKIATGFNRNHMVNNETGIIEEEFRVEYVADRVDTTATVWLGLTIGCARCHDHKFDPISQREFYEFFAYFNNVPERGLSGSSGNAAPVLSVPTSEQTIALDAVRKQIATAEQQHADVTAEIETARAAWELTAVEESSAAPVEDLHAHFDFETRSQAIRETGSVTYTVGMIGHAVQLDGESYLSIPDTAEFDTGDAFSWATWVYAEGAGCVISKMDDANDMRGFDVTIRKGKAIVNLVHQWNRNAIQVVTSASVPTRQWQHLLVSYDGSGRAAGVNVYLNGQPQALEIAQDSLTGSIRNSEPLRLGRRQASASLKGRLDEVRIYTSAASAEEAADLANGEFVRGLVSKPSADRTDAEQRRLRTWFLEHHADDRLRQVADKLQQLRDHERNLAKAIPTTMVMQESEKPRPAFVLQRGEYDKPGEEVTADIPEFLATVAPTTGATPNRLQLADWLMSPANPLTARVTVNRLWQRFFGVGLVKTVDDFGTQGQWPSHPELLDWLALELINSGWDLQHVIRLIVTSASYRQTSNASPEDFAADADNRLLTRGSRFRMPAEMLRDNALAISGLLVEKRGGPSVMPYQPAGLWQDVSYDGNAEYRQSTGADLHCRSLYSFWKRQSPPPNMLTFDSPTRETCTVERSRTNTPLQALVLMNDPVFVEAARKLAERMLTEVPHSDSDAAIRFAFRLATSRKPTAAETQILRRQFETQKQSYQQHPNAAAKLLGIGESDFDESLNGVELAAWTTVASMILSLDETITRR